MLACLAFKTQHQGVFWRWALALFLSAEKLSSYWFDTGPAFPSLVMNCTNAGLVSVVGGRRRKLPARRFVRPSVRFVSDRYKNPRRSKGKGLVCSLTPNTRYWPEVGVMLGQRRERWSNITTTLGQYLVFAGFWWSEVDPLSVWCWASIANVRPTSDTQ